MILPENVLRVPDHLIAEVLDDVMYVGPLSYGAVARASQQVMRIVGVTDFEAEEWWIAYRPAIHLGRDIFVADVAGWCRKRVPQYDGRRAVELPLGKLWLTPPSA